LGKGQCPLLDAPFHGQPAGRRFIESLAAVPDSATGFHQLQGTQLGGGLKDAHDHQVAQERIHFHDVAEPVLYRPEHIVEIGVVKTDVLTLADRDIVFIGPETLKEIGLPGGIGNEEHCHFVEGENLGLGGSRSNMPDDDPFALVISIHLDRTGSALGPNGYDVQHLTRLVRSSYGKYYINTCLSITIFLKMKW